MGALSRWAVRKPVLALVAWFIAMAAVFGLGTQLRGEFNDSFSLPDTESTTATEMLSTLPPSGSGEAAVRIVWSPASGSVTDPVVAEEITPVLEEIAALESVTCVSNPYGDPFGRDCPDAGGDEPLPDFLAEQLGPALEATAKATSPISADGSVAFARVSLGGNGAEISGADANAIVAAVKAANSPELAVGASGQVLEFANSAPPSSEAIGILVAIIILLIAFGSIVAAGMPIIVALLGLAVGQMLILLVARFLDVATFAPTLAAMIGLGVGIDYALFVLNRYRQALLAGHDKTRAAYEAVGTAGRAVQFAGLTVIIALLGLFVLRINFFNGLAVAAAVTVLSVMLAALWLLPALLSLLGTKALALRMPWARKSKADGTKHPEGRRFLAYARLLQRRPIIPTILALGVVIVLALPTLGLRLGFADDGGKPETNTARIAYDLMSEGFGPGVNGPFFAAVNLPIPRDLDALGETVRIINETPGVASTLPNEQMLPLYAVNPTAFSDNGIVTSILITPETAPQDIATSELLDRLRTETAPLVEADTGATMYVGGAQAVTQDFTQVLIDVLPLFLGIVVLLGFLALMVLFRSLLVPLTAAITSLLSFGAAMGITVAVFQWGWLAGPLGVTATGPIFPFLPVMVFAILFGLSMDYQVFLVSRMQEEWERTKDNGAAVRRGLAGSGKVVVIAAAIMSSVFLAFVPSPDGTIKLFGIALASAVIIDAFIVRLVLVPSLMTMFGKANWWMPAWLANALPKVSVEEGGDEIIEDEPLDEADPDAIGDRQPVGV
ncbi:MAG: MMPL family transporter [Candidatus Nanopelagicales bacterium]